MFFVLLTGEGNGCDYTIGCNKTFKKLKAETWDEAKKEVAKMCGDYSQPGISKARVIEATNVLDFDVTAWKEDQRKKKAEKKAQKELEKKKALYEELKEQFEPSKKN